MESLPTASNPALPRITLWSDLGPRTSPFQIRPRVDPDGTITFIEWGLLPAWWQFWSTIILTGILAILFVAELTSPVSIFSNAWFIVIGCAMGAMIAWGAFRSRFSRAVILYPDARVRWELRSFGVVKQYSDASDARIHLDRHAVQLQRRRRDGTGPPTSWYGVALIIVTEPNGSAMAIASRPISKCDQLDAYLDTLPEQFRRIPVEERPDILGEYQQAPIPTLRHELYASM